MNLGAAAATRPSRAHGRSWACVLAVAVIVLLTPYVRLVVHDGNLTRPIRFGANFADRAVPALRAQPHVIVPGDGFDGQFYAQLAFDPLLHQPATVLAMDDAPIRARRGLLPALAWVTGGGDPRAILWTFPLINAVAWLALLALAWHALRDHGPAGQAACLAIVFAPGAIESASRCLPDLPATTLGWAALNLGARTGAAAVGFALAALGRETLLLAWLASAPWKRAAGSRWTKQVVLAAVVVLPIVLWSAWLAVRFGTPERPDGQNISLPLQGVWRALTESIGALAPARGEPLHRTEAVQRLLLLVSLVTQVALLLRLPRYQNALWRWGLLCAALVLCLSWASWEAFFSVTRHLLPLHIAFNVLLVTGSKEVRGRWIWFVVGNLYLAPRLLFWLGYP
jgi:hypothetical protein